MFRKPFIWISCLVAISCSPARQSARPPEGLSALQSHMALESDRASGQERIQTYKLDISFDQAYQLLDQASKAHGWTGGTLHGSGTSRSAVFDKGKLESYALVQLDPSEVTLSCTQPQ